MTSLTGIPLAVTLSAANLHDLRQLLPLVFLEFPPIGGKPGRPLDRPRSVTTDKGYDCQTTRDLLASVGIDTHIPKRGTDDTNTFNVASGFDAGSHVSAVVISLRSSTRRNKRRAPAASTMRRIS